MWHIPSFSSKNPQNVIKIGDNWHKFRFLVFHVRFHGKFSNIVINSDVIFSA
jgi:hypothetical protein